MFNYYKKMDKKSILSKRKSSEIVNDSKSTSSISLHSLPVQKSTKFESQYVPLSIVVQPGTSDEIWTEKHNPVTIQKLLGMAYLGHVCNKLSNWLNDWHKHFQSGIKNNFQPFGKNEDPNGIQCKIALISGPTGSGKSVMVNTICKGLGYEILEINASTSRDLYSINTDLVSKSLRGRQIVLLFDEMEGMLHYEDWKNGVFELLEHAKISKVPLIGICTDSYVENIRDLSAYCFNLRINMPTSASFVNNMRSDIRKMMRRIGNAEKMKISAPQLNSIICRGNTDIRQMILELELFHRAFAANQLQSRMKSYPDNKLDKWDACDALFRNDCSVNALETKYNIFFQDNMLYSLFVHENYLRHDPVYKRNPAYSNTMDLVSLTSSFIADGELIEREIQQNCQWKLMPLHTMLSGVLPGEVMRSQIPAQLKFPAWFSKTSHANLVSRKKVRLQKHAKINSAHQGDNKFILSSIRKKIAILLNEKNIDEAERVMEEYFLDSEDLTMFYEKEWWLYKQDLFKDIDKKVQEDLMKRVMKKALPYPS